MTYMSGVIVRVADMDRFVSGWNDFGKQLHLDAGPRVHELPKASLRAKMRATLVSLLSGTRSMLQWKRLPQFAIAHRQLN